MFNLFRRKKKNLVQLRQSENLIYLVQITGQPDKYRIEFSSKLSEMNTLRNTIEKVLNHVEVYDDSIYIELYKEYQRYYPVYDREPSLLLFRLSAILGKLYPMLMPLLDKDFIFDVLIPSSTVYNRIPKIFKADDELLSVMVVLYHKIYPYLINDKITADEYFRVIQFNYLKSWFLFYYHQSDNPLQKYFDECISIIETMVDESNVQVVGNILSRYCEELKGKYKLNQSKS